VHAVHIDNFIAGETFITPDPTNQQFPQGWRRYSHIGNAFIGGVEGQMQYRFNDLCEFHVTTQYLYGSVEAESGNEPMPFISPIEIRGGIDLSWNSFAVQPSIRFVGAQNRFSTTILPEDRTEGFVIVNIRTLWQVSEKIALRGGIENITDELYWEHTSINNLPMRGRNFYVNAAWNF
jgi:outer membrane receptor for ferrienterochelin and colicin